MTYPAPSGAPSGPMLTARTMFFAFTLAPVWMGLAMYFVVPADTRWETPPAWALGAVAALAAFSLGLVQAIGFRVEPIAPGTPPEAARVQALERFQSSQVVRYALCEFPVVVSMALLFVAEPMSYLTFLAGAAVTVVLMLVLASPRRANVLRLERALDAGGGRSGLAGALGVAGDSDGYAGPDGGGVVKRL